MLKIIILLLLILFGHVSLFAQEDIRGIGMVTPAFVINDIDGIIGTDYIDHHFVGNVFYKFDS